MSRRLLPLLFVTLVVAVSSFSDHAEVENISYYDGMDEQWVDSVMSTMTLEERIGQLFMVGAYSNKGREYEDELNALIDDYHIGGVIFFQGSPTHQARITNRLQSRPDIPLMIGMDAEWGLAMRLDSTIKYPYHMTLGALTDDSLVYRVGRDIAEQCNRLGVHMNFAPVLDINNNPDNPVIGFRSFGENRSEVIRKGSAFVSGIQSRRVVAVGKHFPGHGDTDVDSHYDLPVVSHDANHIHSVEMYPFGMLARKGIGGLMTAHMYTPAIDSVRRPASLSPILIDNILRKRFNYDGLVVSDALNMKVLEQFAEPGEIELQALKAGSDILLFPSDVPRAVTAIREAIAEGSLREETVNEHCRRVLMAKKWAGLDDYQPIELDRLIEDLNDSKYDALQNEVRSEAITLIRNNFLPLNLNLDEKMGCVVIGREDDSPFLNEMNKYRVVRGAYLDKGATDFERNKIYEEFKGVETVVIAVDGVNPFASKGFGVTKEMAINISELSSHFDRVALVVLGTPYVLNKLDVGEEVDAIMIAYQDDEVSQRMSAQALFGARPIKGRLPYKLESYISGLGIDRPSRDILSYGVAGERGLRTEDLDRIDSVVKVGLDKMAYPGCQVLVAKDGMVVYDKAFGYHTYEQKREVLNSDIYDLASITKVASTLGAVMRLNSEGRLALDDTIGMYLKDFRGTPYADIQLRELLAHQAGLKAWIPFYTNTVEKGIPRYDVYSLDSNATYPYRVAENIYIHKNYPDSMMAIIRATPLKNRGKYKYSDLGYYFLKAIVEQIQNEPLDQLMTEQFYRPIGMSTTGYHPRYRFDLDRIPPTEFDVGFRRQIVHGDVHDPGAAMLGGVGGHAGLFSSANDLAKLMYMYSHHGDYGGQTYLADSVLAEYTKCQYCDGTEGENRRGAGFDKPVRHGDGGPTCQCISLKSFGHSGFTGTLAWADPEQDVIYIFLSNRVYPDASNRKLISMGIRTDIMEVLYEALE